MKEEFRDLKIEMIKKELASQLMNNLKQCDDDVLEEIVDHGYSSMELIQMLTKYEQASGLDLINCNEVVKGTLRR